jgi:hypothetical protein
MKRYHGYADRCVVVEAPERVYPLPHKLRHSPSGYAWSYGGSGPADLARSLLWDHLGREPSAALYQEFKWDFVARFDDTWTLTAEEIDAWLAKREPELEWNR